MMYALGKTPERPDYATWGEFMGEINAEHRKRR
jgi:hypothetical protein